MGSDRRLNGLVGLGLVSLLGYALGALGLGWGGDRADVLGFLALFGLLFGLYGWAGWLSARRGGHDGANEQSRRTRRLVVILGFALLFRLAFALAGAPARWSDPRAWADTPAMTTYLAYDHDVWRYLWDGHLVVHGLSPYRWSPQTIEQDDAVAERLLVEDRWWEVFERLDHRAYRTVYPPLAQRAFALSHRIAPASAAIWKLIVIAADLLACLLLWRLARQLGLPEGRVLLYAWNPLVIKEVAGSGHVDALLVAALVGAAVALTRRQGGAAGLGLTAALLVKPTPLPLGLLFLRRLGLRGGLVAAAWSIPFALLVSRPWIGDLPRLAENLGAFAADWEFNAWPFWVVRSSAASLGFGDGIAVASWLLGAAWLGTVGWIVWRDDGSNVDLIARARTLLIATVLLSPTVMPWYLIWALPFAALTLRRSFLIFSGLSLLSYMIYIDQVEHPLWLWIEYGLYGSCLALEAWAARRSNRRG